MKKPIPVQPMIVALFLVSLCFETVGSTASAQITMKMGHVVPSETPRGQGATEMARLITEDARCDITARIYPSAQLGGDTDLIEGLQIGSIEMVSLPASFLVGFQPLIGILDFPFFFPPEWPDLEQVHRSNAMRMLLDTTDEKGFVSLAIWHTGYKIWTSNQLSLHQLENYEGLKVRVMPSAILKEQSRLFGLTPVGMPFSEVYSALQTGAIDAQDNPITLNFFMKFHEVQDFAALTNHGTLDQVIMVAKDWWDMRTEPCQDAIREAVDVGARITAELTNSIITSAALPAYEARGLEITRPTDEEWDEMRAAILPGIEALYIRDNGARGQAILDAFKAEIARYER